MEWTLIEILRIILEVMHEVLFFMHGVTAEILKNLGENIKYGICKPDGIMALQKFYCNNKKKNIPPW